MNFSKCHAEGEGKEWWWQESTSSLSSKSCSSKGSWKDQGKCLLSNIISTGMLAGVSKYSQLTHLLLNAVSSNIRSRLERKGEPSCLGMERKKVLTYVPTLKKTLWGLSPEGYTQWGSNLCTPKWNWLWHELFIRIHSLLTNCIFSQVSVFMIPVSFQFPHWKRLWDKKNLPFV